MPTLTLVRHGQASFGADDYDRLSPLGERQSTRLGEYWRARGKHAPRFGLVITGTLKRQRDTWAGIAQGAGWTNPPAQPLVPGASPPAPGDGPAHLTWPGLNEYDSAAVVHAIHPEPLPRADTPELYREHFRLLRRGLAAWMAGDAAPVGMPSYADFRQGVQAALDTVRRQDGDALIVSSGGPIATAVGLVLGVPDEVIIELNLRLRNSSVTEFSFTPKRHMLLTYNGLPHLDAPELHDWVTYA